MWIVMQWSLSWKMLSFLLASAQRYGFAHQFAQVIRMLTTPGARPWQDRRSLLQADHTPVTATNSVQVVHDGADGAALTMANCGFSTSLPGGTRERHTFVAQPGSNNRSSTGLMGARIAKRAPGAARLHDRTHRPASGSNTDMSRDRALNANRLSFNVTRSDDDEEGEGDA